MSVSDMAPVAAAFDPSAGDSRPLCRLCGLKREDCLLPSGRALCGTCVMDVAELIKRIGLVRP